MTPCSKILPIARLISDETDDWIVIGRGLVDAGAAAGRGIVVAAGRGVVVAMGTGVVIATCTGVVVAAATVDESMVHMLVDT